MTAKADRARELIKDPILAEAFQICREKYRDLIEETPVSDDGALLDIRKMLHLLREVEQNLHQIIENGNLEDFRIEEQEGQGFLQDIKAWKHNRRRRT